MTDLLAELRRSADPADAQVADLLDGLRPPHPVRTPRASEPLAAFLAAAQAGAAAEPAPQPVAGEPDLVVVLAPPSTAGRGRAAALVGAGLWVKAAVAAGVAAAAVAAALVGGPARDVVVRPAHTPTTSPASPAPAVADRDDPDPQPRATHTATAASQSTPSTPHRHPAQQTPTRGAAGPATSGRGDGGTDEANDGGRYEGGGTDDGATGRGGESGGDDAGAPGDDGGSDDAGTPADDGADDGSDGSDGTDGSAPDSSGGDAGDTSSDGGSGE